MPTEIKFGTDGWRAIIAEDYTFANVRLVAQSVADYLHGTGQYKDGLVVGYDTRFASERFAAAVAEVTAANGIKTYLCDRAAPTPCVSYAILSKKAGGAVVITASHNPGYYNGFKYKPEYAGSAAPEIVAKLEEGIRAIQLSGAEVKRVPFKQAEADGTVEVFDPRPPYLEQVKRLVDVAPLRQAGIKIVADAMFGAGAGYFTGLLGGGATKVIPIREERNPSFEGIHPEPIAVNLKALTDAILAGGADLGLATDGDSDRIGVMDENGRFVTQLEVFGLLALYLLEVRGFRGPLIKTLSTTSMIDRLGEIYNVPVHETAVGFKYVGPLMTETNALIGGEESGGFGFRGHIPERDGIAAGLFITDMMVKLGKRPSQLVKYLFDKVGPHYYDRVDIAFAPEQRQATVEHIRGNAPAAIDGVPVDMLDDRDGFKFILKDRSWLFIRFSGTEPLLRVYTETSSPERAMRMLETGRAIAGF